MLLLTPLFKHRALNLRSWWSTTFLGATLLACGYDYPISPSYCDDFCNATLRPGCDREPENCVRECELGFRGEACTETRHALLACYRTAPDHAFTCNEWGSSVRVNDDTCRSERDEALVCELPGMHECLTFCRPLQQALDEQVRLSDGGAPDAAVPRACPLLREPCETLCWNVVTWGVLSSEEAAAETSRPTGPLHDAGSATPEPNAVPAELVDELFQQCGIDSRTL